MTPSANPAPSARFCTAFGEYYDVANFMLYISAFAQQVDPKSADDTRTTFLLVLSPKLTNVLTELGKTAAKPLRPAFRRQAARFAEGTQILRKAGLGDAQIRTLADTPLHQGADSTDLLGTATISRKKLRQAVSEFQKASASVDITKQFTGKQQGRVAADAVTCGVFPDPTVQCETLLSTAELTTLLGDGPALQSSQGCLWTGAELAEGNTAELAVDVSLGTSQYDRAVAQGSGAAPLSGVGDAATALDGFATFSDFGGCGRTLVTRTADHTVTVALCPTTGDVTPEQLAGVARIVLAKL